MDRQGDRLNFSRFKARISTPGNLVTGFQMPGNGYLYVSTTSVLGADTALVQAGARVQSAPPGIAGRTQPIGFVERGRTVIKAGGAPGTVSLWLRNGLGKLIRIGQG